MAYLPSPGHHLTFAFFNDVLGERSNLNPRMTVALSWVAYQLLKHADFGNKPTITYMS